MVYRSAVVLSLLVLAAGCASADDSMTEVPPSVPNESPITTTSRATTTSHTTSTPATTTEPVSGAGVVKTEAVQYMAERDGWHAPQMDIYVPEGSGPWPVAILYHADPAYNTNQTMSGLARDLAETGMVVFNANWGGKGGGTSDSEAWDAVYLGEGPCSYWFAYREADKYGGDPNDISLVGFSGGGNMAAATAMYGGSVDLGCEAPQVDVQPTTVVAFEGDFLLAPWWDSTIQDDPDFYAKQAVWAYIDTYDGAPIRFLVDRKTAESSQYTVTGFGSEVDEFLALRDSDGTITADLEALGALDNDNLDLTEFNTLFHHRLQLSGKATSLTWIDEAPHTMSRAARDAIAQLLLSE